MVAALVVIAAVLIGAALIVMVHRRQWHVRLAREIRALPEHVGDRLRR